MKSKRIVPKRKKNNKLIWANRIQNVIKKLPIIFLLTTIITLLIIFFNSQLVKTKIIVTSDTKNVDTIKIQKKIEALTQKKIINLIAIKNEIEKDIWVRKVSITRKWNNLKINIQSQQVFINWQNITKDRKGYINQFGELFIPKKLINNKKTTVICSKKELKQTFNKLKIYQKILTAPIKFLTSNNIDTIILKNNTKIILGLKQQQQRLKTLQKYYHLFKMRKNSIIDLRYNNGFSKIN